MSEVSILSSGRRRSALISLSSFLLLGFIPVPCVRSRLARRDDADDFFMALVLHGMNHNQDQHAFDSSQGAPSFLGLADVRHAHDEWVIENKPGERKAPSVSRLIVPGLF